MSRMASRANRSLIYTAFDGLAVDAFVVLLCDLSVTGTAQFGDRLLKRPGVGSLQLMGFAVADLAGRSGIVSASIGHAVHTPRPPAGLLCVAL